MDRYDENGEEQLDAFTQSPMTNYSLQKKITYLFLKIISHVVHSMLSFMLNIILIGDVAV